VVNGTPEITDEMGEVRRVFISKAPVRIESGLSAVIFDPVVDTGLGLEMQNPVTIAATVLLSPYASDATQCEVIVGRQRSVFFRYVNYSAMGLQVPVGGMNTFLTSGEAVPETLFAPGLNGFVTPLDSFFNGYDYDGTWVFLGKTVPLQFPLPVCTDSGTGADCRVITARELKKIRDFFKSVVQRYNDTADELLAHRRVDDLTWERARRWRYDFRERSDRLLTSVTRRLRRILPPVFFCGEPPPQCRVKTFPHPVLHIYFDRLVGRSPPYLLAELAKKSKRDRRRFRALLSKYPQVYHRCPVYGRWGGI
jgi:hypothetical protein